MELRKNQIIILGALGIIILFLVLLFSGIIPGLRPIRRVRKIELEFWGIEDISVYRDFIDQFCESYPNLKINYRRIPESDYETELINGLASLKGPDILMIKNTWLLKHYDKISPLPPERFGVKDLQKLFPKVVEQDFALSQRVYALPLSIYALSLIYNQDMLETVGIATLPETWLEFQKIVPRLTEFEHGSLVKAAAAIGGSNKSIHKATDLLFALMLQSGCPMVDKKVTRAIFGPGIEALDFYTHFANAQNRDYTWNEKFGYSLDAFCKEKVAMIFDYSYILPLLEQKNPYLRIGIAPLPQLDPDNPINYADYWGYSVSNQSKYPEISWDFVLSLTTNKQNVYSYLQKTGNPPALRDFIEEPQTLTARSWPQVDAKKISQVFSRAIEEVITGKKTVSDVLGEVELQVTELIRTRF